MAEPGRRPPWVYVLAVAALIGLLWIGWSDVDFHPSQDEVRTAIRSTLRRAIQVLVQFVAPAALLAFLVRELLARVRRGPDR
ncbi:MAG: hypothetical protein KF823_14275 [Xanthomonadales bacterium]|nr:hypothetical protein [Xanthomonadales bacterium]